MPVVLVLFRPPQHQPQGEERCAHTTQNADEGAEQRDDAAPLLRIADHGVGDPDLDRETRSYRQQDRTAPYVLLARGRRAADDLAHQVWRKRVVTFLRLLKH